MVPQADQVGLSRFWVVWPWLVPQLLPLKPPRGSADLLVLLDGPPSRLAAAERIAVALTANQQRLLIRCLGKPVAAQATPELLQSFDTATQITALAQWLQRQQRPLPPRHPGGSAAPTARPH